MTSPIVYRHYLDHKPNPDDIQNMVGLDGFLRELEKYGWAKDKIALKYFSIERLCWH